MSTTTLPGEVPNAASWQSRLKSVVGGPRTNAAIIAGLAIALGLLLPRFLPGDTVSEKVPPKNNDEKVLKTSESKPPTTPLSDGPNLPVLLSRLVIGTVIVLGLSVVSIWAMRRWLQGHGSAGTAVREMRLIETLRLGNRTSLHLVHLGKQTILVGADGGGIKSIVPLPRPFDEALAETSEQLQVASDQ